MSGWVNLGEYNLNAGEVKINVRNVTDIDGLYFSVDAIKLVEVRN